ncbi:cytochrome ubiquinol oxidase subunit I [Microtetraspora sp. AC03309]|uniref:cytochrome ubiquinol oxidase subunit I n=1 Tax=Microtetraspora sp. AC03309 TaxID=2779376 RepID=UPI001E4DC584|nr:cytochrome ubiquinol oxidase subunit I [Microtetraspora sp. AC03309]MCC5576408.1 cytochrome ubiquinol oxidase subunit I [Microtetraspora sp. AC03309]
MDKLYLARWQFGITTVYHFIFVPLTIGLAILVASMQTTWHITGNEVYLRMTKFFGKLFLVSFFMGVVTGIWQEFQFGMNWSSYSRFVGDVFGAPLAMEGLLAFFLESTFLGLWIFGWNRLPPLVHLATIWLAAIGTVASAYFILAANSWMQHPVGYWINPDTRRAELTSIWAVISNPTNLVTVPHVLFAAFLTAAGFLVGVSAWHLARRSETALFRPALRAGLVLLIVAGIGAAITGDIQAKIMTVQQPMKIASAEALYETSTPAPFSLFTIGNLSGEKAIWSLRVPHVLSYLATGNSDGTVQGVNDIQREYVARFGPGDYRPYIPVTYWSFRLMIGFGGLASLLGLVGLWVSRPGRTPGRWFYRAAVVAMVLPFLGNTAGWVFTEMGRQPWTVFGVFKTIESDSPGVDVATIAISLGAFTLIYGILAAITAVIMVRMVRAGPTPAGGSEEPPHLPHLTY